MAQPPDHSTEDPRPFQAEPDREIAYPDAPVAGPPRSLGNPYVGPRSFRQGDKLYGRDWEMEELRDLLIAKRIVLLHSPSGAGKTSLIQASVVPAMQEENFIVLPTIRVSYDPPPAVLQSGMNFNRYVLSSLLSLVRDPDREQPDFRDLAGWDLPTYLEGLLTTGDERPPLFIFDQFEEILTVDPLDLPAKEAFFEQLGDALSDRHRWVLFAMREDYIGSLEPYLHYLPTRLNTHFHLERLRQDAALTALTEPAHDHGAGYDAEVAEQLIDDLLTLPQGKSEFVEPVQLQVVAHALWEHWNTIAPGADTITSEHLAGFGDVDQALSRFYDSCVREAVQTTPVTEIRLRRWFAEKMITPARTRGIVYKGETETAGIPNKTVTVLDQRHLVRIEPRAGAEWCELTHDGFVSPILESNRNWDNRRRQQRLQFGMAGALVLAVLALVGGLSLILWQQDRADRRADQEAATRSFKAEQEARAAETAEAAALAAEQNLLATQAAGRVTQQAQLLLQATVYVQNATATGYFQATATQAAVQQARDDRIDTLLAEAEVAQSQGDASLAFHLAREVARLADQSTTPAQTWAAAYRGLASALFDPPLPGLPWQVQETALPWWSRLAVSPDGRRAALVYARSDFAGLDDQSGLIAWDLTTGAQLFARSGGLPMIFDLAFTADGSGLLAPGFEEMMWLDAATGDPLFTFLPDPSAGQVRIAVSPDGATAVTAGCDDPGYPFLVAECARGLAIWWNLQTGEELRRFGQDTGYNDVAFLPEGDSVLLVTRNGTLEHWDLKTSQRLNAVTVSTDAAYSVAVSPDGTTAIVGASYGRVVLWDLRTGRLARELFGLQTSAISVAVSPDGGLALAASAAGKWIAWDLNSGVEQYRGTVRDGELWDAAFAFDGDRRLVLTAGPDNVIPWNLDPGNLRASYLGAQPSGDLTAFAHAPGSGLAALGTDAGNLALLNLADGQTTPFALGGTTRITHLGLGENAPHLLALTADERLVILDYATGETLEDLWPGQSLGKKLYPGLTAAALSPTGDFWVGGNCLSEQPIMVQQALEETCFLLGGPVIPFESFEEFADPEARALAEEITTLAFSPDGQTFVTGTADGRLTLWDRDGYILARLDERLNEPLGRITAAAFSPDGLQLAAAGCEAESIRSGVCTRGQVRLWQTPSGTPSGELRPLRASEPVPPVTSLVFDSPGSSLATGHEDGLIILWETTSGLDYYRWDGTRGPVLGLGLNPVDYSLYAASSSDGLRVWTTLDMDAIDTWIIENERYVAELSCADRDRYQIEPLCEYIQEPVGTLAIHGESYPVAIQGETGDAWTFSGEAGQTITIDFTSLSGEGFEALTLLGPNGAILADVFVRLDEGGFNYVATIDYFILPQDGDYTLLVSGDFAVDDPDVPAPVYWVGIVDANRVTPVPDSSPTPAYSPTPAPPPSPVVYGATVMGNLARDEQQRWVFEGVAGDIVSIGMVAANNSDLDSEVTLIDPSGTLVAYNDDSGGTRDALIAGYPVSVDGTYTIIAAGYQGDDGTYALTLTNLIATTPTPSPTVFFHGHIDYGDRINDEMSSPGDYTIWRFEGTAGDRVTIAADSGPDGPALQLILADRWQFTIAEGQPVGRDSRQEIAGYSLPETASYYIVVVNWGESGPYSLTLANLALTTPTPLPTVTPTLVPTPLATPARILTAKRGENRGEVPVGGREVWAYPYGESGERLLLTVHAATPANSLDAAAGLDTVLIVRDPDGGTLVRADDISPGVLTDSQAEITLPAAGRYEIEVRSFNFASGGAYTLLIERLEAGP